MIVWSRGLGKQRLPLELPAAVLGVTPDHLVMEGTIEPVCWRYAIRLSPKDLRDFLKILAQPKTCMFLAEKPGILLPFVMHLVGMLPRLVMKMLARTIRALSPAE